MKKALIVLMLILVLVAGVVYAQLGSLVETGIETAGPDTLNVPVAVESVSISPFSGKATIKGLTIGQPTGFGEGPMASLGNFSVKLDTASLLSHHIIIDNLMVDALTLDVRMIDGNTNFKVLQDGLELPEDTETSSPVAESEQITLTIRKLEVRAPRLLAKSDGFLKLDEDIMLADFTLTDMGTDEKGLAPKEIARHIMNTLQPQITKALITAGASDKIKGLADKAKDKLESGVSGLLGKLKKKKKTKD